MADDILKCIFVNENVWIPIKISLKFVPNGQINNIPALVQIMTWRRQGDKPLTEPVMVSLPTHICVTRPQWVKGVLQTILKLPLAFNRYWHPSLPYPTSYHTQLQDHGGLFVVNLENWLPLVKLKHNFLRDVFIESMTCAVQPKTSKTSCYLGRIRCVDF